jgi:hypothetical protein
MNCTNENYKYYCLPHENISLSNDDLNRLNPQSKEILKNFNVSDFNKICNVIVNESSLDDFKRDKAPKGSSDSKSKGKRRRR